MKTYSEFLNKQSNLTREEQEVVHNILSTNESFQGIKNKLIHYFKIGALTISVLFALLQSPVFASSPENSLELVSIYNDLIEKEKGKSFEDRVEDMKNTKDTETNYYSFGEGVSTDQMMGQKRAISIAKTNLIKRLGGTQATVYGGVQVVTMEVTKTDDGKYHVYVLITVLKSNVVVLN